MVAPDTRPEFRTVFEEHVDFVWRSLRYLGVRDRDLDDLVQEVFVVVHRRLPDWRPEAHLRSWLYGICRNIARDHRKRAHVRLEQPREEPERSGAAPDSRLQAREALARIERALAELSEEIRHVFLLYELEGWEMQTIADALSIPRKTAYSRLRLARVHLRTASHMEKANG